MDDTYVYVSVKLYLKSGQTDESIQEIVQEMDYRFVHDDIIEHEIKEILDTQIPRKKESDRLVDPFDMGGLPIEI